MGLLMQQWACQTPFRKITVALSKKGMYTTTPVPQPYRFAALMHTPCRTFGYDITSGPSAIYSCQSLALSARPQGSSASRLERCVLLVFVKKVLTLKVTGTLNVTVDMPFSRKTFSQQLFSCFGRAKKAEARHRVR
jgi:hypothetical protein